MSLFSTFRLIYFLIIALFLLVSVSVYRMNIETREHHLALDQQREFRSLGEKLANGSDFLTNEIQRYVLFGDKVHFDNFWEEVNVIRSRDKAVERLKELVINESEILLIERAKHNSDELIKTEKAAMDAVQNKDFNTARRLVFGPYYRDQKRKIMSDIKRFQYLVNKRAEEESLEARARASNLIHQTNILLILSGLLVLFGFYVIGIRKLLVPMKNVTRLMKDLANNKTDITIPKVSGSNETSDMIAALSVFRGNAIKKNLAEQNLARHLDNLEILIQKRTQSLELSNSALADFASIASHDLQEPLRKVITFGDRIRERIDPNDEQGLEYVDRMQNATLRMKNLIQELLNYSKLAMDTDNFEEVDLKTIITQALSDLESLINETQGVIKVEQTFCFEADPLQISQLLQNLIGNSLKYHYKDIPPEVNISCILPTANEIHILVKDNGIGFDEKYKEKIFHPFQRLHGKGSYQGTGMGLAICKRIVDHHEGTLDVTSSPGEGSTFIVKLPRYHNPPETSFQSKNL